MARVRGWPIRRRIALTILATSIAALIVMSLCVWVAFRKTLIDNLDDSLGERAAQNLALVELVPELGLTTTVPELTPRSVQRSTDGFLGLYSADGQSVAPTERFPSASRDEDALVREALSGRDQIRSLDYGGVSYRVLAHPLMLDGRIRGVLVTGLQREAVTETLAILSVILAIAVPLTSIGLALAALAIARQALRPVQEITETARSIAGGDLRQRILGVETADEVGELASTFNTMIERLALTMERERQFTGDASHELRTPLTGIQTAVEVTLNRPRSVEEYRDTLARIGSQAARMTRMTRQLLMLSRLDSDQFPAGTESISIPQLLEAVIEAFSSHHPDAVVDLRIDPSVMRAVQGDPEMLARAFGNVLENAVLHGRPNVAVRIDVETRGASLDVSVADNGPGMSKELITQAFRRFHRGHGAEEGAGLGLAIVDSIVRRHGGEVSIEEAQPGIRVRFIFPMEPPDPQ